MLYVLSYEDLMKTASIYKIDYEVAKNINSSFKEELISYVFRPERIYRIAKLFNVDFIDVIESLSE